MDLPKGSKALDKAYKGAMQRIEDQLEGFKFLAKKVLGWLTYAERLMTITEIRHAIAVELGEQRFDEDNLADPNELVSVCAGLVVVDDQSDFIRLVHSTTQQYFEQNGESLLPRAQQAIAESCLTYLLYDDFATGWLYEKPMQSWPPETVMNKLKCYPFYNYAAAHWATHARHGVQHSVKSLLLDFARDDHKLSSATQVLLWSRSDRFMASQFDWDSSRSAKPVSAMHTLSYLGADDLISMLLEHEFEADPKDLNNSTPLWWAAYKGEERVVELLLSRKSVDANNLNLGSHHTALFEAAAGDHVDIVKLLIAREDVDVNRCDWERRTPLSQAAKEGHSMVVELLLTRRDVEADTRCWEGKTPLSYALEYSREDIASQLLKRDDVDVDKTDAKINAKPFQPGDSYLRPPTSSRYSEDPHDLH